MKIKEYFHDTTLIEKNEKINNNLLIKNQYPMFYENSNQYIQLNPLIITEEVFEELKYVTNKFNEIFWTISKLFRYQLPQLQEIFVTGDPRYLNILSKTLKYDEFLTIIGRYDWGVDKNGQIKLFEFNCDTPAGLCESTFVTELIHQEINDSLQNPNTNLLSLIVESIDEYLLGNLGNKESYNMTFCCAKLYAEDFYNVKVIFDYYKQNSKLKDKLSLDFVDISEIEVHVNENEEAEYAYTKQQNKIDILYRFYPLEWMADDDFYPNMKFIFNLISNGKILSINPPHTMSVHSKGILALLYQILIQSKNTPQHIFSQELIDVMDKYLLPSYLEADSSNETYVVKPFFSREGDGINFLKKSNINARYEHKDVVYQAKMPLQDISFNSQEKENIKTINGKLVISTYSIGNQFGGILSRVGAEITDKNAYFIPTFVQ